MNLAHQMGILGSTVLMAQSNLESRLGLTNLGSEVVSQSAEPYLEEMVETRPQLIYATKF